MKKETKKSFEEEIKVGQMAGAGATILGTIGAIVGGPGGAIIGAMIGAGLGAAIGSEKYLDGGK